MKNTLLIILIAMVSTVVSAQEPDYSNNGKPANQFDDNHLKQGLWIYFYDSVQTQVSSKGVYVDNKREGIWTEYYKNGKPRSMFTYKNNHIDGAAKIFYETGGLAEEGFWRTNRWIGEYRYYKPSGSLAYEWYFDDNGRRTGEQKYYYDNGKLRLSGTWDNGKETGRITEYYPNGRVMLESDWIEGKSDGIMREYTQSGNLKAEYVFRDGIYDAAASRIFYENKKQNNNTNVNENTVAKVEEESDDDDNPAYERFTGSGYHKLYDTHRRLVREGTFVNGLLVNGKRYYYNSRNEVVKTAIYENGRVVKVIEK